MHTVSPLEGLWSAGDPTAFAARDKGAWDWTMLIAQPDWITAELVAEGLAATRRKGLAATRRKGLPALDLVRFERFAEGRSVQMRHVGSYDAQAPAIERRHRAFLPAQGLRPIGRHHEGYLSDPRRTDAARLRTILRQPVGAVAD